MAAATGGVTNRAADTVSAQTECHIAIAPRNSTPEAGLMEPMTGNVILLAVSRCGQTRAEKLVLICVQRQRHGKTIWGQDVGLNRRPGLKVGRDFQYGVAAERSRQKHLEQAVGNCWTSIAGLESKQWRAFGDPVVEPVCHIKVACGVHRYASGAVYAVVPEPRRAPDAVIAASLPRTARQRCHPPVTRDHPYRVVA